MIEGRVDGDYINQAIKLPPGSDPLICCICGWLSEGVEELRSHKFERHGIE